MMDRVRVALEGARVLVTGGAGFIGASFAAQLTGVADVLLLDNFSRNALRHVFPDPSDVPETVVCDVTDKARVAEIVADFDPTHIVHAAGVAGIDTVDQEPVLTLDVNMQGTDAILRASVGRPALKRVVCFSTSEIFGTNAMGPDETASAVIAPVGVPRWVYAVSKLAGEHLAYAHFKQNGVPSVSLRPFNVYGPAQVGEGALSAFIERALHNKTITLNGDGSQIRSWCYIDDMVQAVMQSLVVPEAIGKAFNVGNSSATLSMRELAERVIQLLGSDSPVAFRPALEADIQIRYPNTDYTSRILGFEPRVGLDEGILRTAEAYRKRPSAPGGPGVV